MTQNAINTDIPIEITNGGTAAATLTDHGVLVGSGTSAITALAVGADNTILIGSTAADPSFSGTPQVTSISFGDEALNYYDEGTWTPALTFGGGSTGLTYSNQTGIYTRVGRIVFCLMVIALSNKGSSVGNAAIGGLPFTSTANGFEAGVPRYNLINLSANYFIVCLENGGSSTSVNIMEQGDNVAQANLTDAAFSNTSVLVSNFWYHV